MSEPKDIVLRNYQRSSDAMPDGEILGLLDVAALAKVGRKTVWIWLNAQLLPPADGPLVDLRPTWRRETVILWLLARGSIPSGLVAEAEVFLSHPEGKAKFKWLRERVAAT